MCLMHTTTTWITHWQECCKYFISFLYIWKWKGLIYVATCFDAKCGTYILYRIRVLYFSNNRAKNRLCYFLIRTALLQLRTRIFFTTLEFWKYGVLVTMKTCNNCVGVSLVINYIVLLCLRYYRISLIFVFLFCCFR